jgi:hypothetical protein
MHIFSFFPLHFRKSMVKLFVSANENYIMNTPTPETDSMEYYFANHDSCAGESIVRLMDKKDVTWDDKFQGLSAPSYFARQLERERDEAQEQRDTLAAAMIAMLPFIEDGDYPNCSLTAFHAAIMKYKASLALLNQETIA